MGWGLSIYLTEKTEVQQMPVIFEHLQKLAKEGKIIDMIYNIFYSSTQ